MFIRELILINRAKADYFLLMKARQGYEGIRADFMDEIRLVKDSGEIEQDILDSQSKDYFLLDKEGLEEVLFDELPENLSHIDQERVLVIIY